MRVKPVQLNVNVRRARQGKRRLPMFLQHNMYTTLDSAIIGSQPVSKTQELVVGACPMPCNEPTYLNQNFNLTDGVDGVQTRLEHCLVPAITFQSRKSTKVQLFQNLAMQSIPL